MVLGGPQRGRSAAAPPQFKPKTEARTRGTRWTDTTSECVGFVFVCVCVCVCVSMDLL